MTDDLPRSADEQAAYAAARRVAVAEARKRAVAGKGLRRPQERPGGIILTSIVVIAVLVGTLAIMIYAR